MAGVLLAAAVVVCCPATARADAGIPMLPVTYQTMLFFLLLVIIIEMIYLQARLKPPIMRTLIAVATVNAATTGLGFPLAWLVYKILDMWADFPGGQSGVFSDMQFVPLWVCTKLFPDWAGTHNQVWAIHGAVRDASDSVVSADADSQDVGVRVVRSAALRRRHPTCHPGGESTFLSSAGVYRMHAAVSDVSCSVGSRRDAHHCFAASAASELSTAP